MSYSKTNRQLLIKRLGGKCVLCNTKDRLEIDHILPSEKSFDLSLYAYSGLLVEEEIKKCQVLCHDCHINKTIEEKGWQRSVHGTASMYNNYGCRCSDCRTAWSKKHCEYKKRLRAKRKSVMIQ